MMSALSPQEFYQSVEESEKSQNFAPIYFFHGEESFLIQQAVQFLRTSALEGGSREFNERVFDASESDISRVRNEIETYPFMSSRRVVILREVADLREAEWETLLPIVREPVASTVFIATTQKLDRRRKAMQALLHGAVSVEFKVPFENQIPTWIRQIARGYGLEFKDDALQLFHRRVGQVLSEIDREVRKLRDFIEPRAEISWEDVSASVSSLREESVFKFIEVLARGDRAASLGQIVTLLDQGQSPLGIVALVARHFRILQLVKLGQAEGLSSSRLAAYAQIAPYFLNEYSRQSQDWSLAKMQNIMLVVAETEKALKSSPLAAAIWLENLVLKICHLRQPSVQFVPTTNTLS